MKNLSFLSILVLITVLGFGQQVGETYTPVVSEAVYYDVSKPLSEVAIPPLGGDYHHQWKGKVVENKFKDKILKKTSGTLPMGEDPIWQKTQGEKVLTTPIQNFEGTRNSDNVSLLAPPDTDGDVGPNHYFQMCNVIFQIFDKNGNTLLGPLDNSTIWDGFIGSWTGTNDGDPIVLYDEHADRWLVSQFAVNTSDGTYWELVAISTSPDPTGTYYRYAFQFTNFPDYPKFGIWRDGYYLMVQHGTSAGDVTASAIERDQMLIGGVPQIVSFPMPNLPGGGFIGMLPADNDGDWAPAGTPNYFAYFSDDAWGDDPVDRLKIWEFDVDWTTPSNSTLTLVQNLDTQPFDSYFGTFTQAFIGQPGTSQNLAALEGALMNRMQYRNFGTHESMVLCHTIDLDNGPTAGTRWYELRKPPGGSWSIHQEGTYAPGSDNYWMASIAMNGAGDIALGYSVSSETTYPSIRYTGRFADDPLGVMTFSEQTIIAGTASQTGTRRWGDYSRMSVDPVDDRTFWYTNEYAGSSTSWGDWVTQIASFSITEYCSARSNSCFEHIANVQIGSINNSSGCDNYRDFTALSTDIPLNYPQSITVTNSTTLYPSDQCGIWIDWNRDGDFYDADEAIAVSGTPGTGPYTATIAVPSGVTLGKCTMRIRLTYTGTVDPCGTTSYGEVEDYTIVVAPAIPNTWTGAVDNNWDNSGNWILGNSPVAGEDVLITSAGFQPVRINVANETCNNLTIDPGATLEIYGFSLDVNGELDNNGMLKCFDPATSLTAAGFSNIGGNVQMENGNFNVTELTDDGVYGGWLINGGNIELNQTTGFPDINATIDMYGGTLIVNDPTSSCVWGYGGPALVTMGGGVIDINSSSINITSGYIVSENIFGGTIRFPGSLAIDNTNFTPTGGTLELYGPNDASVNAIPGSVYNLLINKESTKAQTAVPTVWEDRDGNVQKAPLSNSAYPIAQLDVMGDLTVLSGIFYPNAQIVNVGGSNLQVFGTLLMNNPVDVINLNNASGALIAEENSTVSFTDGIFNLNYAIFVDPAGSFNTVAPNVINYIGTTSAYGIIASEPVSIATINLENSTGDAYFQDCIDITVNTLNFDPNVLCYNFGNTNLTVTNFNDNTGTYFGHISTGKAPELENPLDFDEPDSTSSLPEATPTMEILNDVYLIGTFDVGDAMVTAQAKFESSNTGVLNVSGGSLVCNVDISSGWNILEGQTNMSAGSIGFPSANLQVYNGTISGGTLIAGRSLYTPVPGGFTPSGGVVELVGSGSGHYLRIDNNDGNFIHDLTVNRSATIGIYSSTPTRINGNVLINSGPLNGNNNLISVGGNWTNNAGTGGFSAGTSTVLFSSSGATQYVYGENEFNNVQQDFVTAGDYLQFMGPTQVNGNLVLNYFTWINDNFNLSGLLDLTNPGSKFTANLGGNGTIASIAQGGTIVANGGTITFLDLVENGIFGTVDVIAGILNFIQDGSQFADVNADITISDGVMNYTGNPSGSVFSYAAPSSITMSGGELNFINTIVSISLSNPFTENISGGTITSEQGFFASNPAFTPTGGLVRLVGGVDDNLSGDPAANFFNVEINKSGGKSASFQYKTRDGITKTGVKANTSGLSSDVNINGNLTVNSGTFNFNGNTANVDGTVNVNDGAVLSIANGSTLAMGPVTTVNVNNGGRIEVLNSLVTRNSTGYYSFNVQSGATIAAEGSIFEFMNWIGIYLQPGSLVDTDFSFDNCTFREGEGIGGSSLMTLNGNHYFTANNVNFPSNTWGSNYNVFKSNNSGGVTFMNASGAFAGAAFEFDPDNRVGWSDGTVNLGLTSLLEGPYDPTLDLLNNNLNTSALLPLNQPFNVAPWNYSGTESVGLIPNGNVVDWVLVEVRDAANPAEASSGTVLDQRACFILRNGNVVDLDGSSPLLLNATFTKNLFVIVYHRNHLGIISNYPVIEGGGNYTFDFTNAFDKAYGTNAQKELEPGVWGMISGDADANGTVDFPDNTLWQNTAGTRGYLQEDYDLNGNVDNKDKNDFWVPNLGAGSQIP